MTNSVMFYKEIINKLRFNPLTTGVFNDNVNTVVVRDSLSTTSNEKTFLHASELLASLGTPWIVIYV